MVQQNITNVTNVKVTLFHASWCKHCTNFLPEWEKLKKLITGKKYPSNISIELEDFEDSLLNNNKNIDQTIGNEEFSGYPTIRIRINNNKEHDINYTMERTAEKILQCILDEVKKQVNKQEGGSHDVDYRKKYKKYKSKFAVLLKKHIELKKTLKK